MTGVQTCALPIWGQQGEVRERFPGHQAPDDRAVQVGHPFHLVPGVHIRPVFGGSVYRDLVNEASSLSMRARGMEIKIKSTVNVAKLQKEVDAMSKELRLIDNRIQETNWKTELE